jgi:hypothetical protein
MFLLLVMVSYKNIINKLFVLFQWVNCLKFVGLSHPKRVNCLKFVGLSHPKRVNCLKFVGLSHPQWVNCLKIVGLNYLVKIV